MKYYGICDCDNCYVSCQRVFRPDLNDKPVVVLWFTAILCQDIGIKEFIYLSSHNQQTKVSQRYYNAVNIVDLLSLCPESTNLQKITENGFTEV